MKHVRDFGIKPGQHTPEEIIEVIKHMKARGLSYGVIEMVTGVDRRAVSNIVKRRGFVGPVARAGRPRKFSPEQRRAIIARKAEGITTSQVAREFNTSHWTIRQVLKAGG